MLPTICLSLSLLQAVLLLRPLVLRDVLHAVFGGELTPSHISIIISTIQADRISCPLGETGCTRLTAPVLGNIHLPRDRKLFYLRETIPERFPPKTPSQTGSQLRLRKFCLENTMQK